MPLRMGMRSAAFYETDQDALSSARSISTVAKDVSTGFVALSDFNLALLNLR